MRLFVLVSLVALASCTLVNKNVVRLIEIHGDIVITRANITLENIGTTPVTSFEIPLEDPVDKVSLFEVRPSSEKSALAHSFSSRSRSYVVQLPVPLPPSATSQFSLILVLTHVLQPLPTRVAQDKPHLVKYFGNVYFPSPYPTKEQATRVYTSSPKIENYSKHQPTSVQGESVMYGPYRDVSGNQQQQLMIHFETVHPFTTVKSAVRELTISHFSGVSTEEHYFVQNTGAELDGFFSRYDMQMRRQIPSHAILQLRLALPLFARDIYYRDAIGNISTSVLNYTHHGVDLDIAPRFPLFGGWKIDFLVGYQTPLKIYLSDEREPHKPAHRLLVPVAPTMQSVVVDSVETRVALPEGARNILIEAPAGVEFEIAKEKTFGLLDLFGRPTVVFRSRNLLPQFAPLCKVYYDYSAIRLLLKPVWVIMYLAILVGAVFSIRSFLKWLHTESINKPSRHEE